MSTGLRGFLLAAITTHLTELVLLLESGPRVVELEYTPDYHPGGHWRNNRHPMRVRIPPRGPSSHCPHHIILLQKFFECSKNS